jgi:hypothetical protein
MNSPLLEMYKNGVSIINNLIAGIDESLLDKMPEHADDWTIKEHIIHLVDSEINAFIRLKSIIAQPASECYVMNEEDWTKNLRRKNEDMNKYLKLFGGIRELAYDFIKEEDERSREENYYIRTINGKAEKVTINKWLQIYNNHLNAHVEYIEKIYAELKVE